MSDSETRFGRRGLLRAGVGVGAAATVADAATAQSNTTNDTAGSESEPTDAENGTADMAAENETASTDTGGDSALVSDGTLSSQARTAAILGVLSLGLLSPVLFAVVLKLVYEDDSPTQESQPPVQ